MGFIKGLEVIQNLPFPLTYHHYTKTKWFPFGQQNQNLTQINQTLIQPTQQLLAQHKLFESQLAQMTKPLNHYYSYLTLNLTHLLNLHYKTLIPTPIITLARRSSFDLGNRTPILMWLVGIIRVKDHLKDMGLKKLTSE